MALQRHRMKRPGAARTEKAFKTSRANANSIVGRDFRPNHTKRRAIAGPRVLNGLCDDEGVPLICPACQVLTQGVLAGDRLLLCMGLFSIFFASLLRRGALVCDYRFADVLKLLEKYADVPMSFDACLVRMTETLNDPVLLTTDVDFRIYQRHVRLILPGALPC